MDCRAVFYFAGIRLYVAAGRKPKPPRDRIFPYVAVEEWNEHKRTVEIVDHVSEGNDPDHGDHPPADGSDED